MSADIPQIYLILPPVIELDTFPQQLAHLLDGAEIACLRLALATQDQEVILRTGDALRELAHAREIPLVIADHALIVERLGLDGVHLTAPQPRIRKLRETLGAEAIIGAFCGTLRHDGMSAGEAGADYVSFGPVGANSLGDGARAEHAVFAWWSEMIELPVVAEGALTRDLVAELAPVVDFLAIGEEIWSAPDPLAALRDLTAPLR